MRATTSSTAAAGLLAEVRGMARPLETTADLDPLVARTAGRRLVCIGEASHGTHEFYRWRADLSRRLIEEHGFTWIGVEGDWPDCWRINRWVRGLVGADLDARGALASFERWPTWMWANTDVAGFLDWLRAWNLRRPEPQRVGFYGLDVYSLWDSLRVVVDWLDRHAPESLEAATRAWLCFQPFDEDPHRYASSTRLVPRSCESEVATLLAEVVRQASPGVADTEAAFDAVQNAAVAVGAERYYRVMLRGDRGSWNLRDRHMVDTIARLDTHLGPGAKGLVWAHNSHVGDARATDMAAAGLLNVGQLARERFGAEDVALVGFASHRGTVLASPGWGEKEQVMSVPAALPGSHEDLLHRALGRPGLFVLDAGPEAAWLSRTAGHRAIGVVYHPHPARNFVPTRMGARYDALLWWEETTALVPLHHEAVPRERELETEPTGF